MKMIFFEVISNLHVQGSKFGRIFFKFGGKSLKKLNSMEFMEFVFPGLGGGDQGHLSKKLWQKNKFKKETSSDGTAHTHITDGHCDLEAELAMWTD